MEIKVRALAMHDNIEYDRLLSRDEVLIRMSNKIQEVDYKISNGRIKNQTNQKIKNAMVNSFVYLCQNYLKGLRDKDLDNIKQDLLELKQGNITTSEFGDNVIANSGVDNKELERIEAIIDGFDGA